MFVSMQGRASIGLRRCGAKNRVVGASDVNQVETPGGAGEHRRCNVLQGMVEQQERLLMEKQAGGGVNDGHRPGSTGQTAAGEGMVEARRGCDNILQVGRIGEL